MSEVLKGVKYLNKVSKAMYVKDVEGVKYASAIHSNMSNVTHVEDIKGVKYASTIQK